MKHGAVLATAVLASRELVARESFLFTLETGGGFPTPRAGQFVHVVASDELTLRRPFSVAGVPRPGAIELLFEVRGRGTARLASLPEGAPLDILGPLGNSFAVPREGPAAIVAGGIGVAGIRHLVQELREARRPALVLVGARSRDRLLRATVGPPWQGARIETATDDGSSGFKGAVCELFEREARELEASACAFLCGPRPMLAAAAGIAARRGLACQALLEETMACGVGACRGCVVETKHGYRAVCSDGPVFEAGDILWGEAGGA